jgi:endonuclease/exonuclease/phosphatase (EEP) superfamily protein YafD
MARTRSKNYPEPDSPKYRGDYTGGIYRATRELKVVSWNIQFAREIPSAVAKLTGDPELAGAGILLLQEMDENGVDAIARNLKCSYVYYPASIHRRTGRDFGNAVLSRWPLIACEKVSLPHASPRTGEIRIAAKAHIDLAGTEVAAYSVHTETAALGSGKRREQFLALAEDIGRSSCPIVLVGGDFNTLRGRDIRALEEVFEGVGLKRVSTPAGRTLKVGFLGFSLDHVFIRGMSVKRAGVGKKASASDHLPVWLQLFMDK